MTTAVLSMIAALVTVGTLAVPIMFPLAAGVLVGGPRWPWTAAAAGAGLLLGLLPAIPFALLGAVAGAGVALDIGTVLAQLLGMLCAAVCGVLVIMRPTGPTWPTGPTGPTGAAGGSGPAGAADSAVPVALGAGTGVLVGSGEPTQGVTALFGLTDTTAMVLVAVVFGVLVLAAGTALLVLLGMKYRHVQIGVGVAALAATVMLLPGLIGGLLASIMGSFAVGLPLWLSMIGVPAIFVIATAAAALVGTRTTRIR